MKAVQRFCLACLVLVLLATLAPQAPAAQDAHQRTERTSQREGQRAKPAQGEPKRCPRRLHPSDHWMSRAGQWFKENVRGLPPEKPAPAKPGRP